jgi:ribosome-associated protein
LIANENDYIPPQQAQDSSTMTQERNIPESPSATPIADGIELAPNVRVPAAAVRVQYSRSGGPGGQNVNKLNTKAEVWVELDGLAASLSHRAMARLEQLAGRRLTNERELHVTSETYRSQERNRQEAMQRLRELIVAAMKEPKVRRKTKPSRAAKERRLDSKRRRSQIKARRQGRE